MTCDHMYKGLPTLVKHTFLNGETYLMCTRCPAQWEINSDAAQQFLTTCAMLVERYLLDEFTAEEKSAFEEHLKTCDLCRQGVDAGHRLIQGIKRVGKEEQKMAEENAVPLVPNINYKLRIGKAEYVATLRAVTINNKQHWSFHAPGDPDSPIVNISEL